MDPEKVKAAIEALKNEDAAAALALLEDMLVSAASGGAAESAELAVEENPVSENPEDEEAPEEATALTATLLTLSGKKTAGEAAAFFTKLVADVKATQARQAVLDLSERRGLIADLVKLGAETPATAWVGAAKDRKPCDRLANEDIDGMRARVESLKASRPKGFEAPDAPTADEVITLTAAEEAYCAKRNITPAQFIARRSAAVRKAQ